MLNHAAVFQSNSKTWIRRGSVAGLSASLLLAGGLLAGSASALEGIDLNSPAEPTAEGECPRLIQIKYPFLGCTNGQIGQPDASATWENARQIPMMTDWTEGDGAWGPDAPLAD